MTVVHKATSISEVSDDRTARFVASDESVDRYGDIIVARGWDTQHFKTNPQFLFGHDSSALPIGKVVKTWVEGTRFMADVEFAPEGMDDFADKTYKFLKAGFLNAVSVGFTAKKQEYLRSDKDQITGVKYLEQELLELSLVPIPANANALQVAKSLHCSTRDLDLLFAAAQGEHPEVQRRRGELDILKLRLSGY